MYIFASGKHGTLYIGVTSTLLARLYQHREGLIEGFTSRYGGASPRLVRHGRYNESRIQREKQLKTWNRDWKLRLAEESNPYWRDLAIDLGFAPVEKTVRMNSRLRGNDEGGMVRGSDGRDHDRD